MSETPESLTVLKVVFYQALAKQKNNTYSEMRDKCDVLREAVDLALECLRTGTPFISIKNIHAGSLALTQVATEFDDITKGRYDGCAQVVKSIRDIEREGVLKNQASAIEALELLQERLKTAFNDRRNEGGSHNMGAIGLTISAHVTILLIAYVINDAWTENKSMRVSNAEDYQGNAAMGMF